VVWWLRARWRDAMDGWCAGCWILCRGRARGWQGGGFARGVCWCCLCVCALQGKDLVAVAVGVLLLVELNHGVLHVFLNHAKYLPSRPWVAPGVRG
jgi:hypothetical protein